MSTHRSAVVGIGESTYYRHGGSPHSALQLAAIAIRRAIDDAGLEPREIDGLVTFMDVTARPHANLASWLGLGDLTFAANPMSGGGNLCTAAVVLADTAIAAGSARNIVVYRALAQGRDGRYGRHRGPALAAGESAWTVPFGVASPAVSNALRTAAFMNEYDVTQNQLAEISLAAYAHAQRNPRAVMYGKPLTREAYHASRWIAEPYHLYDCCQESDGAAAIVMTSAERASYAPQPPAYYVAGTSTMASKAGLWAYNDPAWPNGRMKPVAEQLWSRSGISPGDVDVAQFYENFTGTTLAAIADMGFCAAEDVGKFVSDGNLQWPGGGLPLNTAGGNLAEAYIHGFQLVLEAVRQVRGTSTSQVDDVRYSLCVGGGFTPLSSAVLLTGEEG